MTQPNDLPPEPPDWFRKAADAATPPTDAELRPFTPYLDALTSAFQHAARESAAEQQSPTWLHAVFTTAGRLLERAEQFVTEILPVTAPVTRSVAREVAAVPKPTETLISGIDFSTAAIHIRIEWQRDPPGTVIEVQALQPDGSPLRPLILAIFDADTNTVLEEISLTATQTHPRLPNPSPGNYLFMFTWPGGNEQIRIAVKP